MVLILDIINLLSIIFITHNLYNYISHPMISMLNSCFVKSLLNGLKSLSILSSFRAMCNNRYLISIILLLLFQC
jgi:hypothetical protein